MCKENYNWETDFLVSGQIMRHTFSDRVKVITDLHARTITLTKDGERVNSFEFEPDYPMERYTEFLLTVASGTENLNQISI